MAVVEVICKNLKSNPKCTHGPTLRFVRAQAGSSSTQEFFACSAYRDRKDCGFYLAAEIWDRLDDHGRQEWQLARLKLPSSADNLAAVDSRVIEVRGVCSRERLYCHTCSQLDLVSRRRQHRSHETQADISDTLLAHPSQILKPKEGSKKEAQYFFAETTTQVIVDHLKEVGVTRVLCLGTPRVHEHIQSSRGNENMKSLLLDLDHRYHWFWPVGKFVRYNMFNRHALSPGGSHTLRSHLAAGERVALVMDPPFGGHVAPLAATVRHFTRLVARGGSDQPLLVIWVFPYFRERHITALCPSLAMLDYKVEYDNHKQFNNGSSRGSPVRLFTNAQLHKFKLPSVQGYRLCRPCAKWVAPENRHCEKCGACTTKDGRTYVHCDQCAQCVKPRWQHCSSCRTCLPPDHNCTAPVTGTLDGSHHTEPRHKKMKTISQIKTNISNKKSKWKNRIKK